MMVLDVIGVGTVATGRDRLDEVVVLVLLLHLVVAEQHLGIDACRILSLLFLSTERYREGSALMSLQVEEEAELVEDAILIEVVELAGYFLVIEHDLG